MASRRKFIRDATLLSGMIGLQAAATAQDTGQFMQQSIVCVGGHPDDPESMAGGTLAKLARNGHKVTIVYLTTGEAGIPGKSHNESALIRKNEAIRACEILQCTPVFAGQIDGDSVITNEWSLKMGTLIQSFKPDIVFTHWPIDTHKDHQIASLLSIQSWVRSQKSFELYFGEVCPGDQTMAFRPTDYVDITNEQQIKRQALYCHTSQDPPGIYACGHASAEDFRGREMGVNAAEAFIRMTGRDITGLF